MTTILGIERLHAALEPDYVVLGGGNALRLAEVPPYVRLGDNDCAFAGAFRLWDPEGPQPVRDREPVESARSLTGSDPVESTTQ